jgi:hypothetical protein
MSQLILAIISICGLKYSNVDTQAKQACIDKYVNCAVLTDGSINIKECK